MRPEYPILSDCCYAPIYHYEYCTECGEWCEVAENENTMEKTINDLIIAELGAEISEKYGNIVIFDKNAAVSIPVEGSKVFENDYSWTIEHHNAHITIHKDDLPISIIIKQS